MARLLCRAFKSTSRENLRFHNHAVPVDFLPPTQTR